MDTDNADDDEDSFDEAIEVHKFIETFLFQI